MTDWTCCPDEYGPFCPNTDLKAALEAMHINLNICNLNDYYFDDITVGTGDILVFKSSQLTNTYFIADLYREITDQLDIVAFYVSSPHQEVFEQAKPYLRHFFDNAKCQIAYEESCSSMVVNNIVKSKSGDVYRVIKEAHYRQKVIFETGRFAN
ncbi:hypothetical protein [Serratia sp. DD3]|uniref:hypothetical protein n=1 Tax=Serratia sp. DD3 TaxID=1410619 RepID=UPI001267C9B6|nr:hypothetical protein [Serratia sp. DD3]